ncbi:MAG: helix-turn-helix transcriptional regulator [Spirosomataceae bacterium]
MIYLYLFVDYFCEMEIYERIKTIREGKRISQAEMSERLGMATQNYWKIEKGKTELTVSRLFEIAKVLKVSIYVFLGEESERIKELEENYQKMLSNAASDISGFMAHIERCFSVFDGILEKECGFVFDNLWQGENIQAAKESIVKCINNGKRQYFFSLIGFAYLPSDKAIYSEILYESLKPFNDSEKLLLADYEKFLSKDRMLQSYYEKLNS